MGRGKSMARLMAAVAWTAATFLGCGLVQTAQAEGDSGFHRIKGTPWLEQNGGDVVRVVALVTELWDQPAPIKEAHALLAKTFDDTPSLESFMAKEHWLTADASTSLTFSDFYKAKTEPGLSVEVGDIVEIRVMPLDKAKSYRESSTVVAVLCRRREESYARCAAGHPFSAWDAQGNSVAIRAVNYP